MPARHELVSDLNITVGSTLQVQSDDVLVPEDVVLQRKDISAYEELFSPILKEFNPYGKR